MMMLSPHLLLMMQLPHQNRLPLLLQPRHHRLRQSLTRPPLVIPLPYPYLTHVLDIHRRERRMQRHLIHQPIERGGEKDERHATAGLHLDVEVGKRRGTPPRDIVEVHQHRHRPLPAIRGESPPVLIGQIERIEMLQVALTRHVPPHLGQLAMLRRLAREHRHLPQILWQILPREVTRAARTTRTDLPAPLPHHGRRAQRVTRSIDQKVAFGRTQKVVHRKDGGVGMQ
mmetsp:Transcript_8049/g.12956  ORF Transcript_8049/g.12956 Transcript_8049/m.12956 type:complete len:228 (-) Transcript_8049:275-958(-)